MTYSDKFIRLKRCHDHGKGVLTRTIIFVEIKVGLLLFSGHDLQILSQRNIKKRL